MALAAIALGSNLPGALGTLHLNLRAAIERLSTCGRVRAVSSFSETAPVGYTDQPSFLNGAALLETELPPETLLNRMLIIEQELGRDRSHGIAKGPRTLDLDLLFYDDVVMNSARLVLPHPEMQHRRFVLEPLAEIAPRWSHPVLHRSVHELLRALHGGVS